MIRRFARFAFVVSLLTLGTRAAEEDAPKSSAREALKARIAEDAKKAEAKKKSAPATVSTTETPAPTTEAAAKATPATAQPGASTPAAQAPSPTKDSAAKTKQEPATVLPKVEVKKGRITELDHQLAKQEQDIEREKKNLKSSELDTALNDAKVAKPMAIFGGDSTQYRKHVASERVELMEAEKDILEAMARTKSKEEKAKLQKQLDEIRAMRRELDKTLR